MTPSSHSQALPGSSPLRAPEGTEGTEGTEYSAWSSSAPSPSRPAVPGEAPAWSRRTWLTYHATAAAAVTLTSHRRRRAAASTSASVTADRTARVAAQAQVVDPAALEALAQLAVDAARTAGASYAEARLTRTLQHLYQFPGQPAALSRDEETLGFNVRVLANGAWGFSASPSWTPDEAASLAQEAVAQAQVNARRTKRPVELSPAPAVQGRWSTPVQREPFQITIEEKADMMAYWNDCAWQAQVPINSIDSYLNFARQEQTLATSTGTLVSQTLYESGGLILCGADDLPVRGIDAAGKGWELFVDAKLPEQFPQLREETIAINAVRSKPATIGKYTLVCDGVTMARIVEQTFGIATQLDRALGYEANAGGTSFLDDPLSMLGTLQVAAPMVTITANRSAPAQLATVQWDAEGVAPQDTTLVKDGVLVDYQTTRAQAPWLAPYYQKAGKSVQSHGYAAAEDGLSIPLQQMPNLALEPGHGSVGLTDLISDVTDGILVTEMKYLFAIQTDQQARNGFFIGKMRQIKNGRLGMWLSNGAVLFNSQNFWKHVKTLGGPATAGVYAGTALYDFDNLRLKLSGSGLCKGQPPQLTGHSVRGVAALIPDQSLIDLLRKA